MGYNEIYDIYSEKNKNIKYISFIEIFNHFF